MRGTATILRLPDRCVENDKPNRGVRSRGLVAASPFTVDKKSARAGRCAGEGWRCSAAEVQSSPNDSGVRVATAGWVGVDDREPFAVVERARPLVAGEVLDEDVIRL